MYDLVFVLSSCVFLPNNGAFFVNYLITSALIGTAAELCRFPELIAYAARMAIARTEGEKRLVRKVCACISVGISVGGIGVTMYVFIQCNTCKMRKFLLKK